jgi:hypothetical protein
VYPGRRLYPAAIAARIRAAKTVVCLPAVPCIMLMAGLSSGEQPTNCPDQCAGLSAGEFKGIRVFFCGIKEDPVLNASDNSIKQILRLIR